MADRANFNKSVKHIASDRREEMGKFIAHLKTLTPDEFLRLPRRDLERLTMTQYAEVAAAICPGLDLRPPTDEPEPEPSRKPTRRSPSLRRSSMASVAASVIVAVALALTGPIVGKYSAETELVRPTYIGSWPRCARLNESIDGCVYVPRQHLPWNYVAHLLGIDIAELRDLNYHLPASHVPAGEKIIVWRDLGRLEN
ncbi:hypothetical protein [Pelagibacterium lacus]|uniref:Uncharacterized protein n=1 Tax=Pelagibacterium lacus TaxID=2282655 RepID=A0A369W3F1_9HYPH|nr:hypothetical protein [Pelagibacterium lacus]RDE07802.1 hypothetical protein DVH29_14835 [Pelagibacterium lacus]